MIIGVALLIVGVGLVAVSSVLRTRNLGGRPVDWGSRTDGLSGAVVLLGVVGALIAIVGAIRFQGVLNPRLIGFGVVALFAVALLVPLTVYDRRARRR